MYMNKKWNGDKAGIMLGFLVCLFSSAVLYGGDLEDCEKLREKNSELSRGIIETRKELIIRSAELQKAKQRKAEIKLNFKRAVDFYHSLRNLKDFFKEQREEMLEKRDWAQKERIWGDALRIVAESTYEVSSKAAHIAWKMKNARQDALEELTWEDGLFKPEIEAGKKGLETYVGGEISSKISSVAEERHNVDEIDSSFKSAFAGQMLDEVSGMISDSMIQRIKSGEVNPKELAPDLGDAMKSAGDFANNWAQNRAKKAINETEAARDQFHKWYLKNHTLLLKTRNQIETQEQRVNDLQAEQNRIEERVRNLKKKKAALENRLNALENTQSRMKKEILKCYISHDEEIGNESESESLEDVGDAGKQLLEAARAGHLRRVMNLLAEGANSGWRDSSGDTPLMVAARAGHGSIVEYLLEAGANPNTRNKAGNTALMLASQNGHTYSVRVLVDNGADKDIENNQGRTPYEAASEEGHSQCQDLLE